MISKGGWYLLYNVREYSLTSIDLDDVVSQSSLGATNPWLQITHIHNNIFANTGPIFLPEDGEENPNNDVNMGNQDCVGEHDTDMDSPSRADTTPTVDRGNPNTLSLFTSTYNINRTSITPIVNIPTHLK
jgi:hypothetical protein